jgi:hypothetical protein
MFGVKVGRPAGALRDVDVLLADALRQYEGSLCPDCANPAVWMFNPRLERFLQFSEDPAVCNYCALADSRRRDSDKPFQPGEKLAIDTSRLFAALSGDGDDDS